jgi:hypothetical protein
MIETAVAAIGFFVMSASFAPVGTAYVLRASVQKIVQGKGHNPCRIDHVLDPHILVRLVRQIENAGSIGDTVFQAAYAVNMFLVVGAGRDDMHRFAGSAERMPRSTALTTGASTDVMVGLTCQSSSKS